MSAGTPGFRIVDHTADTGVRGWGPDLPSLFRAMAEGLFATIVEPGTVTPRLERRVSLDAESPKDLLHEWLEELNTLHQIYGEVYATFDPAVDDGHLEAVLGGEAIDLRRHRLRIEVKAVTWHDFEFRDTGSGFEAFVLLDI